ncbi:MAG: glutamine synthetase beta-grasp domain-containing protein, partial [Oscillospiraceae bacterium]|nr:glutamine synthetase beta-grasp domain-containing protein [Oscillospiraceae bacterium]
MKKTLQDILQLCKDEEIRIVDFKMTDIDGRWRHLSIPVERLNEDTMTYGVGFDGSNYGYAPVESSDMVFVPDLDSATIDNFAAIPTLSMIGDVMVIDRPQNRPFDQYPRNVARRATEYLKETGIADTMVVGPEYEFYVFDGVQYENRPESTGYRIDCVQAEWNGGNPQNNSGYQVRHHAGYHTSLPLDVTNDLRSQITLDLEDWGVKVKYHHHEVGGCGQLEVEVELGEMVAL